MGVNMRRMRAAIRQDIDPERAAFQLFVAKVKAQILAERRHMLVQRLFQIGKDRKSPRQVVQAGIGGVARIAIVLAPLLARLVILDPNPTAIVRFARKLVSHIDPEAPLDLALEVLKKERFEVKSVDFYETIGLPLSGGYVGPRLVPNWQPVTDLLAAVNQRLSGAATRLGLGRSVCWRYIIAADKLS